MAVFRLKRHTGFNVDNTQQVFHNVEYVQHRLLIKPTVVNINSSSRDLTNTYVGIENPVMETTQMEAIQILAIVLAAVGALNWGLVGLFKFDLVAAIAGGNRFGTVNAFSRLVYVLVAIAGVVALTVIPDLT